MVESGAAPTISKTRERLLRAARALTTPLVPDDYLELINPMWSQRELRGTIVEVRPETEDASTVVIRPSTPWNGHWPGQYLRIGVEVDGIRHWRAYTLTSDPDHPQGLLSITVKHVPEGKLSPFFTRVAKADTTVYLGGAEGAFRLPHPVPERLFMISAGSGVTPIWALLRNLARAGSLPGHDVVHVHCCHHADDFIFGETLRDLSQRAEGYRLIEHHSDENGHLEPKHLKKLCPDWPERTSFLSGPPEMLETFTEHWEKKGDTELLHLERFQPKIGGEETAEVGSGGTIRFRITEVDAESDGRTPILAAGEEAGAELPFGCRMGVCHTCIGRLEEGQVRDLRNGRVHGEKGEMVRTCVNAPEGHVEIDL